MAGFKKLTPSYLTPAQFLALPNDYDFTSYSTPQIQAMLTAASGHADSIMKKSYLAQEGTIRYTGTGLAHIELEEKPLLYVKRVQIALPGAQGLIFPANQLLIDYEQGSVLDYTPLYWQGVLGYVFPKGIPVDVTCAWGYGLTVATAPKVTIVDGQGTGLPAGTYNVAVTSKTQYGETTAVVQSYTTASGVFVITPAEVLGVYVFRAYVSPATYNTTLSSGVAAAATTLPVTATAGMNPGDQWLLGAGATLEVVTIATVGGGNVTLTAGTLYAHNSGEAFIPVPVLVGESPFVAYGTQTIQILVNSLNAPANFWQDILPTTDSSAPQIPDAIPEAVRQLVLDRVYEQNNLANRGVSGVSEGDKRVMWRSTTGNSGRGTSSIIDTVTALLEPYVNSGLYFA